MGIVELLKIYRCDIIGRKTRIFWMDEHWNVMYISSDRGGVFLYMGSSEEEAVDAFIKNEER